MLNERPIYFLSGWMANAGVLPRLLSRCFLFLPMLLAFIALRARVTRVFDAIRALPTPLSVPLIGREVKTICQLTALFFSISALSASKTEGVIEVVLKQGEHRLISSRKLSNYTIGNKKVISSKELPREKQILFKGKRPGFSEVILWHTGGNKIVYHFYIARKSRPSKAINIVEALKHTELKSKLTKSSVIVSGQIKGETTHTLLRKLKRKYPHTLLIEARLSPEYEKRVLGAIYKKLFDEFIDLSSCQVEKIEILCTYPQNNRPSKPLQQFLTKKYGVSFLPLQGGPGTNYRAKFKIVQLERLDGQELNLGLSQLAGSVDDIVTKGVSSLIKDNQLLLKQHNVSISTLAAPQAIVTLDSPASIKVGEDISFQETSQKHDVVLTNWKFAGLEIKLTLKKHKQHFVLRYQTNLSRPSVGKDGHNITGNKSSSSAFVSLNKPISLFQVLFKTSGQRSGSIPWIHKAPILGNLFKSKSQQSNYKNIVGIVYLEEYE